MMSDENELVERLYRLHFKKLFIYANAVLRDPEQAKDVVQDPFASLTLSRYVVAALSGDSRGEIIISFNVKSSKPLATLGVESIDFYTKDGDFVDSVSGSTSNGLVRTNSSIHNSDFVYDLPSGEYYYAEVTVFAQVGSEYDSRTVTTSTVWVR